MPNNLFLWFPSTKKGGIISWQAANMPSNFLAIMKSKINKNFDICMFYACDFSSRFYVSLAKCELFNIKLLPVSQAALHLLKVNYQGSLTMDLYSEALE